MSTEILRPDADGDDVGFTASAGADWECVDEAVADDATTYIEVVSATAGDIDELVNLGSSAILESATINSVTITLRMRRLVGGSDPSYNFLIKENATKTVSGSAVLSSTSFVDVTNVYNTRPSDAGAWTLTDLNALQVGIRRVGDVATGGIRVTQIFVTVDFTPGRRLSLSLLGVN